MKLFDHLRAAGLRFDEMPVIIADEIAAQIDNLDDLPLGQSPPPADYGIVAPPFTQFFVEAATAANGVRVQRGMYITDGTEIGSGIEPSGTHWVLFANAYMLIDGRDLCHYNATIILHLDKDGRLLDDTNAIHYAPGEPTPPEKSRLLPSDGAVGHVPYALMAVSAMHRRCPVELVAPTRQQRRKAQRKHNVNLTDYYVLKVRPQTKQYEFSDIGTPSKAARRQHVVRGHFRYYTEERPLFGRTSGMVWIPEHERGDEGAGFVDKDYEVD